MIRRVLGALNSQRGAAVVFLLAAVLFALIAVHHVDQNAHLGAGSLVADARVVEVHRRLKGESYVVVEFTTGSGRFVRTEVHDFRFSPDPRVGDAARIRYHPDDPEHYVRDDRLGPSVFGVVLAGSFAALFALGAVAGFRGRLPDWVLHR